MSSRESVPAAERQRARRERQVARGPSRAVSGAREKSAGPSPTNANPPVPGLDATQLPLWCGTWGPFLQRENTDGRAQWGALDGVQDREKDINGKTGEINNGFS